MKGDAINNYAGTLCDHTQYELLAKKKPLWYFFQLCFFFFCHKSENPFFFLMYVGVFVYCFGCFTRVSFRRVILPLTRIRHFPLFTLFFLLWEREREKEISMWERIINPWCPVRTLTMDWTFCCVGQCSDQLSLLGQDPSLLLNISERTL